jgi:hypothetical protein
MMKGSTMRSVGVAISVTLTVLAVALPASAAVRPDDRAGVRGVGATPAKTHFRPDDRAGVRVVSSTNASAIGRPDGRALLSADSRLRPDDRAGVRGVGGQSFAEQSAVASTTGGFDWTAAGTGAGAATAAVLLLSWALMLRRNHRRAGIPA